VYPIPSGDDISAVLTPDDYCEIIACIRQHRQSDAPFDVSMGGITPGDDPAQAAAVVATYAEAGVTWWQEGVHLMRPDIAARAESSSPLEAMRWRIRQGPPKP